MSKSGRRRREESIEEEVLRRLPRWRRVLLRIAEEARADVQEEKDGDHDKPTNA